MRANEFAAWARISQDAALSRMRSRRGANTVDPSAPAPDAISHRTISISQAGGGSACTRPSACRASSFRPSSERHVAARQAAITANF
jgi:hypothetical protein